LEFLEVCFRSGLEAFRTDSHVTQKALTTEVDEAAYQALSESLSPDEQALLKAHSSSRIVNRIFASPFPGEDFRLFLRERLGLRLVTGLCSCGADGNNKHVLCCPKLGNWKQVRHDQLVSILRRLAEHHWSTRTEPSGLDVNRQQRLRPDLLAFDMDGLDAAIDVSVVYIAVSNAIPAKEQLKRQKYIGVDNFSPS